LNESIWSSDAGWLIVSWTPRSWLRLGAGPGFYSLQPSTGGGSRESRFGAVAQIGVKTRRYRWLVGDLGFRLHLVPSSEVASGAESEVGTLEPEWTHVTLMIGLGIQP
jgi:hypothetical protein